MQDKKKLLKHDILNFYLSTLSDGFRRGNSPASESGSDAWGATNEKGTQEWNNRESHEFKNSGWDEPDSVETFNKPKEKKNRQASDSDQWDVPSRAQGKKFESRCHNTLDPR